MVNEDFDRERISSSNRRRNERRKKQKNRRIVIIALALLTIIVLVLLVVGISCAVSNNINQNKETETEVVTEAETQNVNLEFKVPTTPTVNKDEQGHYSDSSGGVYIYNKAAFELFSGDEDSQQYYADAINDFKKQAGDGIKVYDVVIPNHTEMGLPMSLISDGIVSTGSQAENIKGIYSKLSKDVTPINVYNNLSDHNNEYIYFNTDHHWSGLGAYYAYAAFCEQTEQKVLNLDVCKEHTIENFSGSLINYDSSLSDNLDTVHWWEFPYDTHAMKQDNPGEDLYETSVYYADEGEGPYSYGVFIWGDSPLFIEYNDDLSNGKKIAVVKESYGNAFVPYLTADYEEVHVIDFRYWDGSLVDYCEENDIDEVLFLNNIMAANTAVQVDRISSIF